MHAGSVRMSKKGVKGRDRGGSGCHIHFFLKSFCLFLSLFFFKVLYFHIYIRSCYSSKLCWVLWSDKQCGKNTTTTPRWESQTYSNLAANKTLQNCLRVSSSICSNNSSIRGTTDSCYYNSPGVVVSINTQKKQVTVGLLYLFVADCTLYESKCYFLRGERTPVSWSYLS